MGTGFFYSFLTGKSKTSLLLYSISPYQAFLCFYGTFGTLWSLSYYQVHLSCVCMYVCMVLNKTFEQCTFPPPPCPPSPSPPPPRLFTSFMYLFCHSFAYFYNNTNNNTNNNNNKSLTTATQQLACCFCGQ